MRTKSIGSNSLAERVVKDIRRATRKHYSAEDKIRTVVDGLRGEDSIHTSQDEEIAQRVNDVGRAESPLLRKRKLLSQPVCLIARLGISCLANMVARGPRRCEGTIGRNRRNAGCRRPN